MEQLNLFPEIVEFSPFPRRYFPVEAIGALELLFYCGPEQSESDLVCPYHDNLYSGQALQCDCFDALVLIDKLGRALPKCSRTRCPVRLVLLEADGAA